MSVRDIHRVAHKPARERRLRIRMSCSAWSIRWAASSRRKVSQIARRSLDPVAWRSDL